LPGREKEKEGHSLLRRGGLAYTMNRKEGGADSSHKRRGDFGFLHRSGGLYEKKEVARGHNDRGRPHLTWGAGRAEVVRLVRKRVAEGKGLSETKGDVPEIPPSDRGNPGREDPVAPWRSLAPQGEVLSLGGKGMRPLSKGVWRRSLQRERGEEKWEERIDRGRGSTKRRFSCSWVFFPPLGSVPFLAGSTELP